MEEPPIIAMLHAATTRERMVLAHIVRHMHVGNLKLEENSAGYPWPTPWGAGIGSGHALLERRGSWGTQDCLTQPVFRNRKSIDFVG